MLINLIKFLTIMAAIFILLLVIPYILITKNLLPDLPEIVIRLWTAVGMLIILVGIPYVFDKFGMFPEFPEDEENKEK